jgi:Mrr N-terminal domain
MAKNFELEDDVIEALAAAAEPLEDVNSVLRRLLGRTGGRRRVDVSPSEKSGRASPGSILSEREYEIPILRELLERGGSGQAVEVTNGVGERLKGKLKPLDYENLDSGDVRWRNRTQFTRHTLKTRGLIKDRSPRGIWELTDAGRKAAESGKVPQ